MPNRTGNADAKRSLAAFSEPVRTWFGDVFDAPTPAQVGAWNAITARKNALVIAPTGSGKTLAAFLAALDRLSDPGRLSDPARERGTGVHTLYVSPLKALGVDVERNLRAPLRGITQTAERLGRSVADISVGVRSGDTPASERRRLVAHPPDILITTPESLFLLLTSAARDILRGVDTVIVDEVHALAGTKRGAHLAVSLERLDRLGAGQGNPPAQRIGLSATVRPPERVAHFLAGGRPVEIVAPPSEKRWDLQVVVPVEDMANIAGQDADDDELDQPRSSSIWPHVEARISELIASHHTTLVFVNSRRVAERLTSHLNDIASGDEDGAPPIPPAQVMAQSGASRGNDGARAPVVARAHHGSVSKEQRALIEADLKSGRLPCVVATSSLELGIDMGSVDVVVQVESPPSVASGLQRVGRAGHQVGAVSEGVFFPNHRGDLVETAVVVERMTEGRIEEVATLANPLDVLAQQIVAICVDDTVDVDDLFELVRGAGPFVTLPRSAFDATLDMLSGRYPSEEFAELRPRLVWDRVAGTVTARPGAQRLAVTSGGTIPDRGLFGVFLAGDDSGPGRRVGELDEEMVYESRVSDVITLGTTSWRIEQITHDRVLVTPAPGQPGRLPFWKGDAPGRPAELGGALGAFTRELGAAAPAEAQQRLTALGLDEPAAANLTTYLSEQQAATGHLPSDRVVLVERFRDELGDWRVCIHSPLGSAVLTPWALAIEQRAREQHGIEVQATATNDGIICRIPDTDAAPPGADLVVFDPDDIERIVTEEVGSSALFAARFRECAARALLLPRRDPRSRSPLWQQRMRAAQLLQVAARYPDFPIILETMRECLDDVFDLPSLTALQRDVAARRVQIVEVETAKPSPFATSLLFGYVGEFVYEGDLPLAEKKAAALSLDAGLLAELLGREGLSQLLDPDVVADVERDRQGLGEHRAGTAEQLIDLIRTTGPFSTDELSARVSETTDLPNWLDELTAARRIAAVRIAGAERWAVVDDLPMIRDGLGIPPPAGYAVDHEPAPDPIGALVLRWARTHGPFRAQQVADRYGLGAGVVARTARELVAAGQLTRGSFTADGAEEYCHPQVLAQIKRRTLARLRREVEPVEPQTFARFLTGWHGVGRRGAHGLDGLAQAVDQLAGYPVPASMLEATVLPARVRDYQPAMLDELLTSGEVVWSGAGTIGDNDGYIRLWPADLAPPRPLVEPDLPAARELLASLQRGGAWRFDDLGETSEEQRRALWELVWEGWISNDSFAAVRSLVGTGLLRRPVKARPRQLRRGGLRTRLPARIAARPEAHGRWSVLEFTDEAGRFTTEVVVQLERYGILTRGSVLAEAPGGGFGPTYRACSQMEDEGLCRRGYFVDGLGAAQFALPGAVDRLRDLQRDAEGDDDVLVLAACDPANPYGAALSWPDRSGHRPGRKPGALVVLDGGELALYVERGGRSLLTFGEPQQRHVDALATAAGRGWLGQVTVERADGVHVFELTDLRPLLEHAGFTMTPQGFRLRSSA